MKKSLYILLASITILIGACDLEKEVDLNLPEFEPKLVVECYLEPGKPYRVILSESVGYFGTLDLDLPVVNNATVMITHNGIKDTLINSVFVEPSPGGNPLLAKVFNYGSSTLVPEDYNSDFHLEIVDSAGRTITATTQLLPVVPLDSVQYLYLQDSSASLLTIHTDNPNETNWYYRTQHKTVVTLDSLKGGFVLDDELITGSNNSMAVGGPPVYDAGDTAIVTLYHITESYAEFLETTAAAQQNNGNPFATPSSIKSNIVGGLGIFTGLTYFRETYYLD